jgi:hypothetical protein
MRLITRALEEASERTLIWHPEGRFETNSNLQG